MLYTRAINNDGLTTKPMESEDLMPATLKDNKIEQEGDDYLSKLMYVLFRKKNHYYSVTRCYIPNLSGVQTW